MSNIQYNPSLNDKVNGQLGDLNVEIQIPLSSIKTLFDKTPPAPYKVYTALVSQNGGDDPLALFEGDDLTIGVTYLIDDGYNFDFTNVGAPNNDVGTSFVATGTTPNSWGIDGLLQCNLGAPTVTVLENTIGDIWFTYEGVGYYSVNSSSLFTANKTTVILSPNGFIETPDDVYVNDVSFSNGSTSGLNILSFYNNVPQDTVLNLNGDAIIEIRVYN